MSVARHPRPPELVGVPIEDIMQKFVGRFREKKPDWAAFEDAKIEGYKRAQHRFIGAGGSGKHGDLSVIPAKNFTLSIMYVEPGQGNAAHTHEVEEVFFVLQGFLDVFVEDESGKRLTTRLGPWECIACPAGVIHGYQNDSLGPVYFQVMLGRGKPETMGYADDELHKRRDAHLNAVAAGSAARPRLYSLLHFDLLAASLIKLRSECALTSKLALTKPRSFVMSTFFCSAPRSGTM